MKRAIINLTAVAALALSLVTKADYYYYDGTYTWSYTLSGSEATITDLTPYPEGALSVPAAVGTSPSYPVTGIGAGAFMNCNLMKSIVIPDSITSIGDGVFWGCTSLADDDGFVIVRNVIYDYIYDEEYITIPWNVTSVGAYAFWNNPYVESVTISGSTTSIGKEAFRSCSELTTMTIPNNVTSIGTDAFKSTLLSMVHVQAGDTDRIRGMIEGSGYSTAGITFVEDVQSACTVTFNANGGSPATTAKIVWGGMAIGTMPTPAFDGHLFIGWFTDPNAGAEITAATLASADATLYAHWTEITAGTWFTRRDAALAEAKRTGKKVFLIRGRDTCPNTMYTKNTACENASVKAKLVAKCVLWYCNIDEAFEEESRRYKSESTALPLVCVIDPNDPDHFLKRSNGRLYAEDVLALIADLPYPSGTVVTEVAPEVAKPTISQNSSVSSSGPMTLKGAMFDGSIVAGFVELKLGRVNSITGTCKASGSVTMLDGKKHAIRSQLISISNNQASSAAISVKGLGTMNISIGGKQFAGTLGRYGVWSANVGGAWTKPAAVTVEMDNVSMFNGTVIDDLLPINVNANVSNGKWSFPKASAVKWTKTVNSNMVPLVYGMSGKTLVVDESRGKTNHSGLKLTYTPKTGLFKGSFKLYELQGTKLKKYTVNVNGLVVDGVGYGKATCKKPAASWPVSVK